MKKLLLAILFAGLATGAVSCALIERARMYGTEAAARAVALECSLSQPERQKNLDGINGWLLANDMTGRAVALDCDGDGTPDF